MIERLLEYCIPLLVLRMASWILPVGIAVLLLLVLRRPCSRSSRISLFSGVFSIQTAGEFVPDFPTPMLCQGFFLLMYTRLGEFDASFWPQKGVLLVLVNVPHLGWLFGCARSVRDMQSGYTEADLETVLMKRRKIMNGMNKRDWDWIFNAMVQGGVL